MKQKRFGNETEIIRGGGGASPLLVLSGYAAIIPSLYSYPPLQTLSFSL